MRGAPLQAEKLCGAAWEFSEQGSAPWGPSMLFLPDGRIGGYENSNEAAWRIVDGRLEIYDAGGELSWRFIVARHSGGRLELEGTFMRDDSFKGVGSLTEMAPDAAAAPAETLAILVAGHEAPKILDRLAAFFDGLPVRLFVHIDAKAELTKYTAPIENISKITFIEDRVPLFFGGFSMVAAELALLRAALADPAVSNVVLISDDTAPLAPAAEIYQALRHAPDRIASAGNGWREGWYRGFFYPDCNFGSFRGDLMHELRQFTPADFAMITRLEALRARGKRPVKSVQFCGQWWALSREKLEPLLQFVDADEHLMESFRFSLFSDETFFPTVFKLCFPDETPLEVPTFADFATVPRHPNPWIYQSAKEIERAKVGANKLFIRKVAPEKPDIIDDLIAAWTPKLEAVRLVVWGLDETFWRGTLTEGAITDARQYHDIVMTLAKRGIVSSICSRQDEALVKHLLTETGMWDYFVFPSINGEPKGPRVAEIVKAAQLPAPSVLFIDDNVLVRKEVLDSVPGIQLGNQTVIAALLTDPLLQGANDIGLTRLAKYKLLETRHKEPETDVDDTAFLHASDIRVTFAYDVAAHLEQAVALINHANELNLTRQFLPEDSEQAGADLRSLLNRDDIKAALVRVEDRYGDYGYAGIYVLSRAQARPRLVHYCFSSRVKGMGVEAWLYEQLGHPDLAVTGEGPTDLFAGSAPMNWINRGGGESVVQSNGRSDANLARAS